MARRPLNIILLGRKVGAVKALNYLNKKGSNIKLVVAPKDEDLRDNLYSRAKKLNIQTFDDDKIYDLIRKGDILVKDIDLVIAYLHISKIKEPLLSLPRLGAINFHPGPLPDYRGWASYNYAILNSIKNWGATAHYMDKNFDTGPIIKVNKFNIDLEEETAYSLEKKTQKALYEVFKFTIKRIIANKKLPKIKNTGGKTWTKREMEEAKFIDIKKETPKEIDKKIRAYFFPPYDGAKIVIKNKEYNLINQEILNYIKKLINEK